MATIEKRGPFQFRAKIRIKGFAGKSKTFNSRKEAEVWARKTESEMERGLYVDSTEAEQTILHDALDRYLREITPSKKGAAQEKDRIIRWQRHPLAKQALATIRGTDLAKYRDTRISEGKSPNTIRLELAVISHLFTIARKEWGMESLGNPVQNIRMPNNSRPRDRRLLHNEEERLLAACKKSKSKALDSIVIMAIETAMRQGELLGLEWEHVDLKKRIVHLPDTKNGLSRDVPLSMRALEVLKARPRNISSSQVFYEWKRGDSLGNSWRRAVKNAGLEGLRFHDLRHEATSRFFEKDLNIMEVAAITGHQDLKMLKRYTHLRAEDLAQKLG